MAVTATPANTVPPARHFWVEIAAMDDMAAREDEGGRVWLTALCAHAGADPVEILMTSCAQIDQEIHRARRCIVGGCRGRQRAEQILEDREDELAEMLARVRREETP